MSRVVTVGCRADKLDLSGVDHVGFADLILIGASGMAGTQIVTLKAIHTQRNDLEASSKTCRTDVGPLTEPFV
jgi:hypothetical protein